ncbi:DegT/DnrJ/EryC1/StrS family aminotransferase [Streptomyces sp. NPDC086023]|uniref:DegT/DnrJ/EryC1/StrS family aminotransferase n=1 Tax=Streptomyces sp. NPDC086023 TaxID=3365746 RepID=UPI0037D259D1
MTLHPLRPRPAGHKAGRTARPVAAGTGAGASEFERDFAAYVQAPHAVSVGSGTDAIELSLRALALPPQGRVLLPAMTPHAVARTVLRCGLRPALVDVDPLTAMPSAETVARAVRACGRPAAMVTLDYAGRPAPVAELAEAAGLPLHRVLEDASYALGAYVDGHPVGSGAQTTCFGFRTDTDLPLGRGGMVTTRDERLAARIRRAEGAAQGLCLPDALAALGRARLPGLRDRQRRREVVAARYTAALHRLRGLTCPAPPQYGCHAWHLYLLRVLDEFGTGRDEVAALLAERGVGTSVRFAPLHHTAYLRRHTQLPPDGLPGADSLSRQLLSLPIGAALPEASVDRVCAVIARSSGAGGARHRPRLRTFPPTRTAPPRPVRDAR